MSLVRPECACCGEETTALAVISDPFSDSCYGICRMCLGPIYEKSIALMRRKDAKRQEGEVDADVG